MISSSQDLGKSPQDFTWRGVETPPRGPAPGARGRVRAVRRGAGIVLGIGLGLVLLVPTRLVERLLVGAGRPVTPWIVQAVCGWALFCLGLRCERRGTVWSGPTLIAANHVSWLDILVIGAVARTTFVAKAEVASWPGIGALARATGTVFVRRDRRDALGQAALLANRVAQGACLCLFPEGTSTDGLRVLPFRSALFAAFLRPAIAPHVVVQPASIAYRAPAAEGAAFYGWWGDMALAPHLFRVLSVARQGQVRVTLHKPLSPKEFSDRKALAAAVRSAVAREIAHP